MKYRIFSASAITILIIITVFISGPVLSEENTDKRPHLASSTTTFEGTLVIKEGHGDILVLSADGDQRRLKVKQSTVITRNGQPAKFRDLQVHDKVSVSYDSKRVAVVLAASGS